MTLLSDILKGCAWGLVLLALVWTFVASSATVFVKAKGFYTNDGPVLGYWARKKLDETFYTHNKQQQYKKTYAAIADLLHELELQIEAAKKMHSRSAEGFINTPESQKLKSTFSEIGKKINDNCFNCSLFGFKDTLFSEDDYRIALIFLERDIEELKKLKILADSDRTNYANKILVLSFLMGLLTILLTLYLFTALLRYKNLTATGLTILILLITPLLLITVLFMSAHVGNGMTYIEFEFGLEEYFQELIIFSLIYCFIVYPPIMLISKNKGYSLGEIFKLKAAMCNQRPLDEIEELNGLMKTEPPPLPLEADPDSLSYPLATRWPRFFARIFDVWWETLLITSILVVVLNYYFTGFDEWISKPGASPSIGILGLPIALIFDALLYRIFGNTPGKALLGLKVGTLDGKSLSLTQYNGRNLSLWCSGLAFGFPLVNLFTMARQGGRLAKGLQASYDVSTGFRVRSKPSGWVRKTVFGFAFTGLLTVMSVLNIMEQKAQRETILSNNQAQYHEQWRSNNAEVLELLRNGNYDRGVLVAQDALQYAEEKFDPDHPYVATSLNNLAELYRTKGDYSKAEPLYKRSLAIYEKTLGPDHTDVAMSLNNLALLYRTKGDYSKAEPLFKSSLAIYEKALGPDHPDVAISLNNLALSYFDQGDYAKAEPLLKRSLAIKEKILGPDHPSVATSLNNLAWLYQEKGEFTKAEPLYKRSLAIYEKTLGPDHPDVALALHNLAFLYRVKNDYTKADPLYKRSLAIKEKSLGPDHPDVALSLNHLAGLYRTKGDYSKAEPLLKRSLAIKEKVLGPDHPDVATSLENLAVLYRETKHVSQAKKLEQRAAKIRAMKR